MSRYPVAVDGRIAVPADAYISDLANGQSLASNARAP
jgi:hypothetical protein